MAAIMDWEKLSGEPSGDSNTSPTPGAGTTLKRGRKPKGTSTVVVTKAMIVDAITLINLPIQFSGYGAFALTQAEIDEMADAWLKVIKQNPYVAKYLVNAGKVGVWGNLLVVHAKIISARMELYSRVEASKKRDARSSNGMSTGPTRTELLS